MSYFDIDLLAFAQNPNYLSTLAVTNITTPAISLLSYHDDFQKVLGPKAKGSKIAEVDWRAFHEAGVYHKKDNSLYVTSNYEGSGRINVTVVSLDDYSVSSTFFPNVRSPNGGSSYFPPGSTGKHKTPPLHVYCDVGGFDDYSKLVAVDPVANTSKVIVSSYMGRNFSGINDVKQHDRTGDLWFSDTDYGHFQGYRPPPDVPKHVYRYEPKTGTIQVVADGFLEPNGLEFSPDFKTLYVSDTGRYMYDGNATRPATIYAFDVDDQKRLSNRRTFAFADNSIPDGLHTDTKGNLFVSAGDGVHVWSPKGILLGKIFIGEGSANFAFGPGKIFVFAENRLWLVSNVKAQGREVCKDFGVGC